MSEGKYHGHQLFPYCEIDGIRTLPDSFMTGLWERLVDDKILTALFYEGSARTAPTFLEVMKRPANTVFLVRDNSAGPGPAGVAMICWLNNWRHRRADIHFAIFRSHQGRQSVALGRWLLGQLFGLRDHHDQPLLDIITGFTPASNRLAVRWLTAGGRQVGGIIPDGCWLHDEQRRDNLVISYLHRYQYHQE